MDLLFFSFDLCFTFPCMSALENKWNQPQMQTLHLHFLRMFQLLVPPVQIKTHGCIIQETLLKNTKLYYMQIRVSLFFIS